MKNTPQFMIGKSKIFSLFILLFSFIVITTQLAYGQQQRIKLTGNQISLRNAFEQIKKQTGLSVAYEVKLIDANKIKTNIVKEGSLNEVMNNLLEGTDCTFSITSSHVVITAKVAELPSRRITGIVTDEKGEGILGANIRIKGEGYGVSTDIDGNFSLEVSSNTVLIISYIGFVSQEVNVGNSTRLTIVMNENSELLDEVIVIGYGTVKRKDFTGSVSSVKLETSPIALTTNLNTLESLKGNVPGLNIGATNEAGQNPNMLIRGQNSINGSNNPLIILDGVIYLGSIRDVNPNDIASIDVLKDATSAAAYGSRSANGVIAITTKKGTTEKPVITFNANIAAQTWQNRPKLMNADQWFASVNARNGYEEGSTNWLQKGELMNLERGQTTDWLDVATRTGFLQDYQVSIAGDAPKANYYVSAAYSENKGIVRGDDFDRISLLGKLKTDITSWLEVGIDAAFSKVDYSGQAANISEAYNMPPYGVNYRDEEKKLIEKYPVALSIGHPLWGVYDEDTRINKDIRDNFRLGANFLVKVPWIKGLTYRFNYMRNWEQTNSGTFSTERFRVREGDYDDMSRYSTEAYESLLAQADGNITHTNIASYVIDNIINYNQLFGKHNIDVTLVGTRDLRTSEGLTVTGKDFAENGNTSLGLNGLNKATTQTINQSNDRRANIGYMARASYSFDDKYYLTGSIRRDGSSVFGANNKWGYFGAFGVAWRMSKEKFMEDFSALSDLKLKLSWGQNGNQGISPYSTLSRVSNGQSGGIQYQFSDTGDKIYYGLYQTEMGNSNLGWESSTSYNIGFESSWFTDRLGVDIDIYKSKTTDQLFTRNIPVMTGFKTIKTSMGRVDNLGVEASLRSINIKNRDWMWTTVITYWKNKNKLKKLYGEDLDGDGKEDDDISNSLFIGKSLGAIYGYKQIGIVQEDDIEYMELTGAKPGSPKYEDIDGEPGISATDRQILGYSKENFRMSFSSTLTYKNLDLYVMITGTFGGNNHYLASNQGAYMTVTGRFNNNGIYIDHWTPENRSNVYPDITFAGDGGRFLGLQNRGFVRVQDVTLSYTFRQAWMKKSFVRSMKVFCTAKNLLTFTKWKGGDPETGATVRGNTFPVATTFSFGTNISF